jgi:RNA polymerase sigma-70 factor (ECF subfamily)
MTSRSPLTAEAPVTGEPVAPDASELYRLHGRAVWATLSRMGVRQADLADMTQEVFVVVHRRLGSFEGRASVRGWISGICRKVASNYRRRPHHRESSETPIEERSGEGPDPEQVALRVEMRRLLDSILDVLDPEKRAVLVMYEIEGLSCQEIADELGVPIGTIHSRLHAARSRFKKAFAQHQIRHAEPNRSSGAQP